MSDDFKKNGQKEMYECKVVRDINEENGKSGVKKNKNHKYFLFYSFLSLMIFSVLFLAIRKPLENLDIFNKRSIDDNNISVSSPLIDEKSFLSAGNEKMSPEQIYAKYSNSIVKVLVSPRSNSRRFSGFGDIPDFYGNQSALGSGIVISSDGYILTNAHVVSNSGNNPSVNISFENENSSEEVNAKIVGVDETTDLALIKVNKSGLVPVVMGDSNQIKMGQKVCAIGYPLGVGKSITTGIVSGINRCISDDVWSTKYIQLDAAINSGNSGGALFNDKGEVVGINTIKIIANHAEGMGFAIPSSEAIPVVNEIKEKGYSSKPRLGISVSETKNGVFIEEISRKSELSGFAGRGDQILGINGRKVLSRQDIADELKKSKLEKRDNVLIKIRSREDMQTSEFPVKLIEDS